MSSFNNKHVLITGGAGGIGLLMAKRITQEHAAHLFLWDIKPEQLKSSANKLNSGQTEIHINVVDIGDPDQIYEAAGKVFNQGGSIDIIINNAGVVTGKRFEDHSREEIERSIRINLLGMMHVTRAFLPGMREQKSGHIVNIASAAGLIANPKMSVYAGSKWGVIGWSESLRIELNQQNTGINVTTVEPSYIDTGMFKGVTPPLLTPLLEPEDITGRIIQAVKKNKIHLRAPFLVKFIPFLKGLLPTKVFDFIAGKLFRIHYSMDTFEGRRSN